MSHFGSKGRITAGMALVTALAMTVMTLLFTGSSSATSLSSGASMSRWDGMSSPVGSGQAMPMSGSSYLMARSVEASYPAARWARETKSSAYCGGTGAAAPPTIGSLELPGNLMRYDECAQSLVRCR